MVGIGGFIAILQFVILVASDTNVANIEKDVYIILLKKPSLIHHEELEEPSNPRDLQWSNEAMLYKSLLIQSHDNLLKEALGHKAVDCKLYSYTYLINGFAASLFAQEADLLARISDVVKVEKDERIKKLTTYTPIYLGLPKMAWRESSIKGVEGAGEDIVIGLVDTGIDPTHPSFANTTSNPYYNNNDTLGNFKGKCEVAIEFPQSSCNGKIVAARHFANAAKATNLFNATTDFDSPFDGDGHGTHTASIAAGNHDIVVEVAGMCFGNASGMAPRARLAIYKALYPGFGGFYSDVVAALEKAVEDGVDILSLSIGPTTPPRGVATYFNVVDLAVLAAVKAGVFVVQAGGNGGPSPFSIVSFSPWISTVAAIRHDRTYSNSIILGNNSTISGLGLSPGTEGTTMHTLVLAKDAITNYTVAMNERGIDECQNSLNFEKGKVEGKILVCAFSFNFLVGRASVKNVVSTAKELSASGVVLTVSPLMEGFNLGAASVPFKSPVIIIPQASKSKEFLDYCMQSYQTGFKEVAVGRIVQASATFSDETPRVAVYSSRGPDLATFYYTAADVLKPNIAAPGTSIWAAWTPNGLDAQSFQGERFALISGTSMATPHIAGIAALVKQKLPQLSPAGIASALATTASVQDGKGNPLLVETSGSPELATPFDMGNGLVNATAAMDPGLIFDAGYDDYVNFLCTVRGGAKEVKQALGQKCKNVRSERSKPLATNLNAPYITVANLRGKLKVVRVVTHVGELEETYQVSVEAPKRASVEVIPSAFTLEYSNTQRLEITLKPFHASSWSTNSFGSILITGNHGHFARIPIALTSNY